MDINHIFTIASAWVLGHVGRDAVDGAWDKFTGKTNGNGRISKKSVSEFKDILRTEFRTELSSVMSTQTRLLESIDASNKAVSEGIAVLVDRGRR